jgi:hypothetical protein
LGQLFELGVARCSSCRGLPQWSVSQPYLNLFLADEPLAYQPSVGRAQRLRVGWKQRYTAQLDSSIGSLGAGWNSPWLSYIFAPYQTNGMITLHWGNGMILSTILTDGWATNYHTNVRLSYQTDSSGQLTTFFLLFPDGSQHYYGFARTNDIDGYSSARCWFLSAKWDRHGPITSFLYDNYDPNPDNGLVVRLTRIVDVDGQASTLTYTSTEEPWTNLVSRITDPYGRSASFIYTNLEPWLEPSLIGLQDAAGLASSLVYATDTGWLTDLTTPYGTTYFWYQAYEDDPRERQVTIREPTGAQQMFAYQQVSIMPAAWPDAMVPTNTPLGTLDNEGLYMKNTFYWNRQQYAALGSTTNLLDMTTNQFYLARIRHWLGSASEDYRMKWTRWPWSRPLVRMAQRSPVS